LQEIGIKEERIITLQTQMQQAFIIDKEFLYEILRDSDNLKQELVKFIRGKSLQEKKEVEYCINYSSYESYEKARPSYIKESV